MGISCQRNGHWAATNHLSGRGLVQPIKESSSAAGRCAERGCALIRQLANAGRLKCDNLGNCYSCVNVVTQVGSSVTTWVTVKAVSMW